MLYYETRNSVVWRGYILPVFFVILTSLSSAGGLTLSDPWQILGGAIDNGYIVVFGPLVILMCVLWFDRSRNRCLELRRRIDQTVKAGDLGKKELNHLEEHMISAPSLMSLNTRDSNTSYSKFLSAAEWRIVPIFGLISTAVLLNCLAQWVPKKTSGLGPTTIFFGYPNYWRTGIDPTWDRFEGLALPWVYPPFYTIVYGFCIFYLVKLLWKRQKQEIECSGTKRSPQNESST